MRLKRSIWLLSLTPALCLAQGKPPRITIPAPLEKVYFTNLQIASFKPIVDPDEGAVDPIAYGQVSTLAGSSSGRQDGQGVLAKFLQPTGVDTDAAGNIYVADCFNHSIRKITPEGLVSTIAGTGSNGRLNGKAADAKFDTPFGVMVDQNGNIFVADAGNNQIRKITPEGIVTVYAGNILGRAGAEDGIAGTEKFTLPASIVFDELGNMYLADTENHSIRKITPNIGVTTFSGYLGVKGDTEGQSSVARFEKPIAIARDPRNGDFYVADYINNKVRRISSGGRMETYAGTGELSSINGPRLIATFDHPTGLTIDNKGNVYVSDDNNLIRRISAVTGLVSTIAGDGNQGNNDGLRWNASFYHPIGLAFDIIGNLYVADEHNHRIRKITLGGGFSIDKALPNGLVFNPTNGEISGTPTEYWPETLYTITAHNDFGEGSDELTISVVNPTLTFPAIAAKMQCDPDFDPGATAFVPITYSFSDPLVANYVDGKIHILNVGTTIITATNGYETKSQTLVVSPAEILTISISSTQKTPLCSGTPITFTANASENAEPGAVYSWYVNGVKFQQAGKTLTSNSFSNRDRIYCIVTGGGSCYFEASTKSNTLDTDILDANICNAIIPTAFSPNGDGINDTWKIPMLVRYPKSKMSIYNRFGVRIFEAMGYELPWNGNHEGKPLPAGIYYYIIDLKPEHIKMSGSVAILK
ncbi:MAG: gliding motility-associated C-terminal domain-containing protein [Pedobacter sp.]